MDNKTLVVPVGWKTEGLFPKFIKIEFSPELIERIKKVMQIVKDEDLSSAKIEASGEYFEDEECTIEEQDFRSDVEQFKIHKDSIFFYAQNKWDSSSQFESQEITLKELETGVFDPHKYD